MCVSIPLVVAVVPSLVQDADLLWNPMSSSLGHVERQQVCRFVRTEGQPGMMEASQVWAQRPIEIRTPVHGGERWEQERGLRVRSSPYQKATSSPSSLIGVCTAPPGLRDPIERTYRLCPFPWPDRFETLQEKAVTSRDPPRVRDRGFPGGPVANHPVPRQETWVSPPVREEPTRCPYASVMESVF